MDRTEIIDPSELPRRTTRPSRAGAPTAEQLAAMARELSEAIRELRRSQSDDG